MTIARVVILLLALFAANRFYFWYREGLKLQESGYLPPKTSKLAYLVFAAVTRLLLFLTVGPVKVIGAANARNYKGRLLIAPNHTYQFDFAMASKAVPSGFRYLADTKELTGFRAPIAAWTGAFGVNTLAAGAGKAVIDASVAALLADRKSRLLVFPQGMMVKDNILRQKEFKTGAVRMVKQASAQSNGQWIAILPVAIHYKRDPKDATFFHRFMHAIGLKFFRNSFGVANYGGTVVVGSPIPAESLPDDPRRATEVLRETIQILLTQAKSA